MKYTKNIGPRNRCLKYNSVSSTYILCGLGKFFSSSVPQFLHLYYEENDENYFSRCYED